MIRERFNKNWEVGTVNAMIPQPVPPKDLKKITLPYDCMQDEVRRKDAPSSSFSGYYPAVAKSYTKYFEVPAEWEDKYVVFDFEGVYMNASVFINDDYAGGMTHGYTEFYVEANKFLRYGRKNKITVSFTTAEDSRWYSGAGIYRNVNVMVSELIHIQPDSYRISAKEIDEEGARVTVDFAVRNLGHKSGVTSVVTRILDGEGTIVGENESRITAYAGEVQQCRQSIYLDGIKRWSIEEPYLYQVETKVMTGDQVLDEEKAALGIRTLQLDPKHGLRINGKVVKLRGACVHHDNGMLGAAAIERAEERRAQLLKAAGFNAVRSAHNPISKAFLDACDRVGLVVMDEVSDIWTRAKTARDYASVFPFSWEQICEAMVKKDYNHPSVIMYSIGNEIQETGTAAGADIGRKLVGKIRSLDDTRYILNSINATLSVLNQLAESMSQNSETNGEGQDINNLMMNLGEAMAQLTGSEMVTECTKESFDCLDICGYNYATVRYGIDSELFPNRILVGSETSPREIADNWEEIMKYPQAIGDFTWTGWDYLGEAGAGKTKYAEDIALEGDAGFAGEYPWMMGYCADLDLMGNRRPISYYREIVFGLTDVPYLGVEYPENFDKTLQPGMWDFIDGIGSWSFRGYEGKPIRVHVFGNGDSYKLFLNGEEAGSGELVKKRGCAELTYEPGELKVITYKGGAELGTYSLHSAKPELHIRAIPDRTEITASETDLCYVDISICDEDGIVDNMADCMLSASVSGNGELIAFGSANPKTEETFHCGRYTSFDGKAMAILRPTSAGRMTLKVEADGYEPVEITITAK